MRKQKIFIKSATITSVNKRREEEVSKMEKEVLKPDEVDSDDRPESEVVYPAYTQFDVEFSVEDKAIEEGRWMSVYFSFSDEDGATDGRILVRNEIPQGRRPGCTKFCPAIGLTTSTFINMSDEKLADLEDTQLLLALDRRNNILAYAEAGSAAEDILEKLRPTSSR